MMDASGARLLQRTYEADDDERRTSVLVEIARAVSACGVHALVTGPRGILETTDSNGQEAHRDEYLARWQPHDPRFALALARPFAAVSDAEHLDARAFEKSAFYNEFLLEMEIRHTLMVVAPLSHETTLAFAFLRPPQLPAFAAQEQQLLSRLVPHLHRAARLRDELRQATSARDDLAHALDLMAAPMLLLDAYGAIVLGNHAARVLLDARDGVCIEAGRLCAAHPADDREVLGAIARAALFAEASTRVPSDHELAAQVLARRKAGAPLCLAMYPLRPDHSLRVGTARARVLVSLHDPSRRSLLDASLVAARYGLTKTEAALTVALVGGHTVAAFAREHGCAEQTARSHLKRVFDKTRTRRQSDLVRAVLELHRTRVR